MLYSKAVAEDLVSEVFYQFYAKETYEEITISFRAYLFKAVRSRALNFMRWEAGRSADIEAYDEVSDRACQEPDSIVEYEELYHSIQDAINAMPPQRRKIFLMNRFENLKYAEIASDLGLSPRTVEVQIRKASIYLKGVLKGKWGMLVSLLLPVLSFIQG
jgi:RNA polymerase sigma-70 factor (ECF subfamily)